VQSGGRLMEPSDLGGLAWGERADVAIGEFGEREHYRWGDQHRAKRLRVGHRGMSTWGVSRPYLPRKFHEYAPQAAKEASSYALVRLKVSGVPAVLGGSGGPRETA